MPRRDDPALRRLVNAVLWPGFLGTDVPGWLRRDLDEGLAGAVLFAQNLGDDDQRRRLAASLHAGRDDVFVGIDEEGGNVTRLEAGSGSSLPGAWQLGHLDDVSLTEAVGAELARRSLAAGANVVLAPVADVNVDPRNPVIGVRSYGTDPGLVSRHVAAQVRGIQRGGAAACAKHFPGHGDTHVDSHYALPTVDLSVEEIERLHLAPFRAAIEAGVASIMTGHLVVPEWGDLPATLNPAILGRLRELGFEGAIVTDALDMAAVRATVGAGPGAVLALRAGADLLCIGNPTNPGAAAAPDQDERDIDEVRDAILGALVDGELAVEVLERAAARVAVLAESVRTPVGVADAATSGFDAGAGASSDGSTDASFGASSDASFDAREVARAAITVHGALPDLGAARLVLDARRATTLAVDTDADVASTIAAGGRVVRIDPVAVPADQLVPAVERAVDGVTGIVATGIVVLVDALDASAAQRAVVEAVAGRGDAVVVHVGVPSDSRVAGLPVVETRAASRLAAVAAAEVLGGSLPLGGSRP
ncbi:glycoside hydrolase family 3 protein [Agromyces sp. LHK192]|uniref:glycoside hydrolase family 3 protein n=1 Tax=Agromyces sp. LHK192 TaxID=2498704 RepID=UPI000FDCA5AA|nr:glycoside hydrolase family 3 N-terminal domain-containing protein [Agromyces sp. LHK192]